MRNVFVISEVNNWKHSVSFSFVTPHGRRDLQGGGCRPPHLSPDLDRPSHHNTTMKNQLLKGFQLLNRHIKNAFFLYVLFVN